MCILFCWRERSVAVSWMSLMDGAVEFSPVFIIVCLLELPTANRSRMSYRHLCGFGHFSLQFY